MSFSTIFASILLAGWLGGRLAKRSGLPSVLGMLLAGILLGSLLNRTLPTSLVAVEPFLKSFALIVILLRAVLGINRKILKQTGITAILMASLPCLAEGTVLFFAFRHFFGFSVPIAGMTAFMLAAVSPAVIVPSMLNLKELGYGANKQVPTIVLAGASLDDVFAITLFSIFIRMHSENTGFRASELMHIPLSILAGIAIGATLGFALLLLFRKVKQIRATEKVIVLLALCLVMIEVGDYLQIASFLGAMTVGYIIFEKENLIAKEISAKLAKIWIFAEILLFVLIGLSLNPAYLLKAGWKGLLVLVIGLGARSIGVVIATAFSRLNKREKLFCVISYLPKATVQAALGTIPLSMGIAEGDLILAIAVMSICLSAPIGLILINRFGSSLLCRPH
jgi:solute carrier family 9B (sodium/hydrogen exchanger), member 1/2